MLIGATVRSRRLRRVQVVPDLYTWVVEGSARHAQTTHKRPYAPISVPCDDHTLRDVNVEVSREGRCHDINPAILGSMYNGVQMKDTVAHSGVSMRQLHVSGQKCAGTTFIEFAFLHYYP